MDSAEGDLLLDILRTLDATPAPHGREREAAVRLHEWCSARWPWIHWEVQGYGDAGANLVGRWGDVPESVLLYSHLDTSLDGDAGDAGVTGRTDGVGPLLASDAVISGFGLGVARGPAAAALAAFVQASPSQASPSQPSPSQPSPRSSGATLLLAGSGTHRLPRAHQPTPTTGVQAYLATNPDPHQVIIAKAGPPGVLHSEPGAAYLTVRITARQGAVLARRHHRPEGGVLAHAGVVFDAIENWRRDYLHARPGVGQLGAEVGIGYVASGLATKPDLIPAVLDLGLYLVTLPGENVPETTDSLEKALAEMIPAGCAAAVTGHEIHEAGVTDPGAPIVQKALVVRERRLGPAESITDWTGSTDGVVFRGRGIDTVRLGPTIKPSPDDPRRDETSLATLVTWSNIYRELLS